MRVLILSCSTGGGHNACGHYIEDELKKNNIICDFVDYFDILGPNAKKNSEKIYLGSTKRNGKIFKLVYKLGEAYSKTGFTSPVYSLNKLGKDKLYNYIKEKKYDLIISTHIFPSMTLTTLKDEYKDIKFINVATDYHAIPFWEETTPDYFVIPHESLKKAFIEKGFKEEILLPLGISISSRFKEIKNNIYLSTEKDVILITSGSMGFGNVKNIVEKLLDKVNNVYIIAICGNNEELYNELEKINNPNLLVKKFVNNINEYIAASTIVLTKPGGLTSTEVAVIGKPMIHLMPIPGVENYNAEFFRANGLSLVSKTIDEVIINTKELLNDKEKQAQMIENQAKTINKNSAEDLVNFILRKFNI